MTVQIVAITSLNSDADIALGESQPASIEDPFVIDKILSDLEGRGSLRVSDSSPKEHGAPPPAVC